MIFSKVSVVPYALCAAAVVSHFGTTFAFLVFNFRWLPGWSAWYSGRYRVTGLLPVADFGRHTGRVFTLGLCAAAPVASLDGF